LVPGAAPLARSDEAAVRQEAVEQREALDPIEARRLPYIGVPYGTVVREALHEARELTEAQPKAGRRPQAAQQRICGAATLTFLPAGIPDRAAASGRRVPPGRWRRATLTTAIAVPSRSSECGS
jgi:hypothetical protein